VFRALINTLSRVTPKHPLAMRTTFRDCFVVSFTMAPETLAQALPSPLTPDPFAGRALLSVVIVDMERMRPAFLPPALGVSYQQVLYRAIVRCGDERGVHFLRSDADNPLMVDLGNLFSFFKFHRARILRTQGAGLHHFDLVSAPGQHADIHATFDVGNSGIEPPRTSVFPTLQDVRQFLVERYSAFSPSSDGRRISSVDIERGVWNIRMLNAPRARFDLLDGAHLFPPGSTQLDSIIHVEDIEYLWHTVKHRTI
jgi:uncharacterized protein YqjF (DUF2071 family)